MDVSEICASYEAQTLTQKDDVTLAEAADTMENARKHFFDGLNISALTQAEIQEGQRQQALFRHIADSIWRLLLTRYGCDD